MTSTELLAKAAISEDKFGQAFTSFGPERRSAPVQAYVRIGPVKAVRVRSGITEPDVVVVLDPGLMGIVKVQAGLKAGGIVIINTHKTPYEVRNPRTMRQQGSL